MYWNINKTLSFNAYFNFIVGSRGCGKTYGAKKFCVNRFLKTGEQFVYVRRYDTELNEISKFFDDIIKNNEFPNTDFKVKGRCFYANDELIGYAQALSTAKVAKGTPSPNVNTIIFDEFILDKGYYRYIPDEVTNFLELVESVFRMRDNVRVLALSNALTTFNPYFTYFNISLPYGSNFLLKNDILIEMVQNKEYIEKKKQTRFGQIIQGTKYGDYNIENKFLLDNPAFIEKKSGKCNYLFTIRYKENFYGVWANWSSGKIFISDDIDKSHKCIFAITKDDMQPNVLLFSSLKKSGQYKIFTEAFKLGCLYFESNKIKGAMYEVLKLTTI